MEGPHGQLSARFADRLCSNNANRFAAIDQSTASEVTAITLGANTKPCFTRQRGSDFDFVDALNFQFINDIFVQHVACRYQNRTGFGVGYIFCHRTAKYTVTQ